MVLEDDQSAGNMEFERGDVGLIDDVESIRAYLRKIEEIVAELKVDVKAVNFFLEDVNLSFGYEQEGLDLLGVRKKLEGILACCDALTERVDGVEESRNSPNNGALVKMEKSKLTRKVFNYLKGCFWFSVFTVMFSKAPVDLSVKVDGRGFFSFDLIKEKKLKIAIKVALEGVLEEIGEDFIVSIDCHWHCRDFSSGDSSLLVERKAGSYLDLVIVLKSGKKVEFGLTHDLYNQSHFSIAKYMVDDIEKAFREKVVPVTQEGEKKVLSG